jgi:hypothetical protein
MQFRFGFVGSEEKSRKEERNERGKAGTRDQCRMNDYILLLSFSFMAETKGSGK